MIVYFEDGELISKSFYSINGDIPIRVDAGMGYSSCRKKLIAIDECFPFNTKVYTNSLVSFSNTWCWDEEKKMPMIYIREESGEWRLISELTERELRRTHNLARMYVAGEFDN